MKPFTAALYDVLLPPLETRRSDEAISLLELALHRAQRTPISTTLLRNCHFKAGEYAAAAIALTTATGIDPTRAEAFSDLAIA